MIYIFLILFFMSFFGTIYAMPHSIRKLRENDYLVNDMYKLDKTLVPTNGGMILVFTSFISICLLPLLVRLISFLIEIEISFLVIHPPWCIIKFGLIIYINFVSHFKSANIEKNMPLCTFFITTC